VLDGELDAAHRVLEEDERVSGLPIAVDRDLAIRQRECAEAVDRGTELRVVIETRDEPRIDIRLRGRDPIHGSLAEDRQLQPPHACRKQGVVRVVPLAEVVERLRTLRKRQAITPAFVDQVDLSLRDLDRRPPVLAHRPQLDQVGAGSPLRDGPEDAQ